jgi:hypothetical protein
VREWPERLRVGGADKVWLFFICLCPSKEMKPICLKQILHPNIKKIVYDQTTRKIHILLHKSYIGIEIVFYFLF